MQSFTKQLLASRYQLRNLPILSWQDRGNGECIAFEEQPTIFAWSLKSVQGSREFRYNAKVAEDVGRLEAGEQR